MNFRTTGFLFVLLLGMLWLFGFMLSYKKTALDESYVLPTLQRSAPNFNLDHLTVERRPDGKEAADYTFTEKDEVWTLKQPCSQAAVKVEGFKVRQMINQVKDARKNDEAGV